MKRAVLLSVFAVLLVTPPAFAGFPGDTPDRVQVDFGGMIATVSTQAGAGNVRGGVGTTIVFENLFNIPVTDRTGFVNGWWRFTERSYLDFGWLNIDRSGSRVLSEDISFKEYTFLAGSSLTGDFKSTFPYAAYRYDFLHLDQVKISGSAGISYMDLAAYLSGEGEIIDPEGNTIARSGRIGSSVGLPVPLIGVQLDWAISKRNSLSFYSRFIYVNYAGLRASVGQQSIHYYFHPTKHFAFGAGVDKLGINIPSYENEGKFATFAYNVSGLTLFGKLAF